MRFLLDLQTLQSQSRDRGIGRYSMGLAAAILDGRGAHDAHVLFNAAMPALRDDDFERLSDRLPADRRHWFAGLRDTAGRDPANASRAEAAGILRDTYAESRGFDLVHVAGPFDGYLDDTAMSWGGRARPAIAATLYDMIPFLHPDVLAADAAARDWHRGRMESLRRADLLLAISDYTQRTAVDVLGLPEDHIVVIGSDVDPVFRPLFIGPAEAAAILARHGVTKPFIMHTGSPEPRKNVEALLAALGSLDPDLRGAYQLVLAGAMAEPDRDRLCALAGRVGLWPDTLLFPGHVDDAELAQLYNLARVTVMPSKAEGFGLPLLEAMRCGCAVLGANATSLPEVIGHPDLMFDPLNVADIARKLHDMLCDNAFLRMARNHAALQQRRFSWQRSAAQALAAFERTLARHGERAPAPRTRYVVVAPPGIDVSGLREALALRGETLCAPDRVASAEAGDAADADLDDVPVLATADGRLDERQARVLSQRPAAVAILGAAAGSDPASATELYRAGGLARVARAVDSGDWSLGTGESLRAHPNLVALLQSGETPAADLGLGEAWIGRAIRELRPLIAAGSLTPADLAALATALADNHGHPPHPRLLVDVSDIARQDRRSGIQRVVISVLRAMVGQSRPFHIEPVRYADGYYRFARGFASGLIGHALGLDDEPVDFCAGDAFLGLDFHLHAPPEAFAILRAQRQRGMPVVFTVYDLLPLARPDWFPPDSSDLFAHWLSLAVPCADRLVCISHATADTLRDEIARMGHAGAPAIETFHLGADFDVATGTPGRAPEALDVVAPSTPIFVCVGTLEPRKGHRSLLDAFDRLWTEGEDCALVVVGRPGWMVEDVLERIRAHARLNRHLFWFDDAGDGALAAIYRRAAAVVSASEGEGYGLPLIEAARHGRPIIARDLPVFREIAGENAYYFDGGGDELAQAIRRWRALAQEGRAPQSEGIRAWTWAQSAGELLGAVERAVRSAQRAR